MPECSTPPLADTLRVVLPTDRETWLLRACLQSGQAARSAWQTWRSLTNLSPAELVRDDGALKGLLPLLFTSLRQNQVPLERELLTILRTAHLREELRAESFRRIYEATLAQLARAEIPSLLLKGAALAATVYPSAALRHTHDVEILVRRDDLAR